MILSLTTGRVDTITVMDMNPVLQYMPFDENKDVLIEAPSILSKLGIVTEGTVWTTRKPTYGNQKGCQDKRDR
eukprot:4581741-Prorocentrum_lima.AAC.1